MNLMISIYDAVSDVLFLASIYKLTGFIIDKLDCIKLAKSSLAHAIIQPIELNKSINVRGHKYSEKKKKKKMKQLHS